MQVSQRYPQASGCIGRRQAGFNQVLIDVALCRFETGQPQ
jgi:hypothetical protein